MAEMTRTAEQRLRHGAHSRVNIVRSCKRPSSESNPLPVKARPRDDGHKLEDAIAALASHAARHALNATEDRSARIDYPAAVSRPLLPSSSLRNGQPATPKRSASRILWTVQFRQRTAPTAHDPNHSRWHGPYGNLAEAPRTDSSDGRAF